MLEILVIQLFYSLKALTTILGDKKQNIIKRGSYEQNKDMIIIEIGFIKKKCLKIYLLIRILTLKISDLPPVSAVLFFE
jgi:hypothetical protein